MSNFNYQKLSRDRKLKKQHVVNSFKNTKENFSLTKKELYDNDMSDILNGPDYIVKFGKYKGVMLGNIPLEYIVWSVENITSNIVNTFIRELERRKTIIDRCIIKR